MDKKNKNILTIAAIGVLIYFLLKKRNQLKARSGGGGGGTSASGSGNIFSPSNVSAADKSKIRSRVKAEVSKLNFEPITDDWQDAKMQYDQDIKECRI